MKILVFFNRGLIVIIVTFLYSGNTTLAKKLISVEAIQASDNIVF